MAQHRVSTSDCRTPHHPVMRLKCLNAKCRAVDTAVRKWHAKNRYMKLRTTEGYVRAPSKKMEFVISNRWPRCWVGAAAPQAEPSSSNQRAWGPPLSPLELRAINYWLYWLGTPPFSEVVACLHFRSHCKHVFKSCLLPLILRKRGEAGYGLQRATCTNP